MLFLDHVVYIGHMTSLSSPRPDASPDTSRDIDPARAYEDTVASFVAFWGEMASQWGINRTMAQIHARLFCAGAPMNTDEIMEALDISRGNANMNLRSLTDWQLVSKKRLPDSRKDYYQADTNVWRITARIIEERQRRELQPVQSQLERFRNGLPEPKSAAASSQTDMLNERLAALIELLEAFESMSDVLLPLVQQNDLDTLTRLVQMARMFADSSTGSPAPSHHEQQHSPSDASS